MLVTAKDMTHDTWHIHFIKTNPWRDSKLLPSQSGLCTTEFCTTEAGSVQHKPPQTDPKQPSSCPNLDLVASQGLCKRQQVSASTQLLLAHTTSNFGKKATGWHALTEKVPTPALQ